GALLQERVLIVDSCGVGVGGEGGYSEPLYLAEHYADHNDGSDDKCKGGQEAEDPGGHVFIAQTFTEDGVFDAGDYNVRKKRIEHGVVSLPGYLGARRINLLRARWLAL